MSFIKELRPYQAECLATLRKRLKETTQPLLVNASVGAGKSLIIASLLHIIEKANWRALCLTMNSTLIQQNAETYNEQGGNAGIFCAGLKEKNMTSNVIFGSPHSVVKNIKDQKKIATVPFNLIVVDECFPAGTFIDNRHIESLLPGEYISSYNHHKQLIEKKKILNIQRRTSPEIFYCIRTHYAVAVVTGNHPFYVHEKGYMCAKKLNIGDVLYVNRSSLHHMWNNNKRCFKISKMETKKDRRYLSYGRLRMEFKNKKRKFFPQNEEEQSYVSNRIQKQNDLFFKRDWAQTNNSRWKWTRINRTSTNSACLSRRAMVSRACSQNKIISKVRVSSSLQNRYRQPFKNDSYRNRWRKSLHRKTKIKRQEKNGFINFSRVESVEVYKRSDIERIYPSIQFDYVYNLEVEDNNNYFANNILVHNCHNIDHNNNKSMYMRILNHYGMNAQFNNYAFRVVGLTGTPYRGKSISIVGPDEYFKEEVCSISSSWLIDNGFLVPPVFGKTNVESFDMSRIRVDNMGKFKHKDLQDAVDKNERLTGLIMKELIEIVEAGRQGVFIFASTLKHAAECMRSLPPDQSACITGDTPHDERKRVLADAKTGIIKYLVNVATLLVGVDVPNFDVCAWLRPTESLTLYTQGIGRVLRLSPGKADAVILDYAGNVDRHGDIDDPLINEAQAPKEPDDPDYCIQCHDCNTMNKETARRCIGVFNRKRCDHYFTFKECESCHVQNDIAARHCRNCKAEIINPNDKLRTKTDLITLDVLEVKYWISVQGYTSNPIINVRYKTQKSYVFEAYFTGSDKAKIVFYNRFLKLHIPDPADYWPYMQNLEVMKQMIQGNIYTPVKITCKKDKYDRLFITKKIFNHSDYRTTE